MNIVDSDSFVDLFDLFRSHLHFANCHCVLFALSHDGHCRPFARVHVEVGARTGQSRAHDVGSGKHEANGTFVDLLMWQNVRILVQEFQGGVGTIVPLLEEQDGAVDLDQLDVLVAFDQFNCCLFRHDCVHVFFDVWIPLDQLTSDAPLNRSFHLIGVPNALFGIEFLKHVAAWKFVNLSQLSSLNAADFSFVNG